MTMVSKSNSSNVNLEVFVNKELDEISRACGSGGGSSSLGGLGHTNRNASSSVVVSYSQENKIIRQSCVFVKGIVSSYGTTSGAGSSSTASSGDTTTTAAAAGLPEEITVPLLSLLKSCLESRNEKVIDPALSCLHKLIAYAYLQGETRPSGRLDDVKNMVNVVVLMAARAANRMSLNSKVQLTAVKTLLTASTAEHFVPHGDCLMLAVRTAFNIAVNGSTKDVQNAAASALLQMMNTILKRVAHQEYYEYYHQNEGGQSSGATYFSPSRRGGGGDDDKDDIDAVEEQKVDYHDDDDDGNIDDGLEPCVEEECNIHNHNDTAGVSLPKIRTKTDHFNINNDNVLEKTNVITAADQRAAQLSQLAERSDVRGLEEAFTSERVTSPGLKALNELEAETSMEQEFSSQVEERRLLDTPSASAKAVVGVSPTETPIDHHHHRHAGDTPTLRRVDTPPDPRRALMKDARAPEWKVLTVTERDIVIVFGALCKMASRETGAGAVSGTYYHAGKLLALDTIVKVFKNPMHDWDHIRPELAVHLRQPLCLTILRNCKSPYDAAVNGSVDILCSILNASSLRATLRAEIGALYPLVLLRPLENSETVDGAMSKQAMAALRGLEELCGHPQVLVDIFVNFDCSLQSSNLFERSINILAREAASPMFQKQAPERAKIAQRSLLKCIDSLDTWAGPLKPLLSIDGEQIGGVHETLSRDEHVLEQLHRDKAKKSSLQEGLVFFNDNPVRGLQFIIDSGVISPDSESIARFLVEQSAGLDPEAIGELLGHHEDRSIEVMHCYVRKFNFKGMEVDQALRLLLKGFRLPGEAQKIDRIMEKFAEKYCEDNPDAFPIADAAYLLAFAIIMLNTDAHNPMAERRIQADDFVTMCTYQTESGDYDQILPTDDLLKLHQRILSEEIAIPESKKPVVQDGRRNKALRKLAAATGLSKIVAPFHAGNAWDKQHGAEQERLELYKLSMQLSMDASITADRDAWRSATHAEHARPMLQVSGDAICKSLSVILRNTNSIADAMPILKGYEQAVKLSALLWLENLTLSLVQGLANAAGFGLLNDDFHKAVCPSAGSSQEARNVACLSRLVSLGSTAEAGLLGSAWVIIFRLLSGLEQLKKDLSPELEEPRSPSSFSMNWVRKSSGSRTAADVAPKARKKLTRTVRRESQGPLTILEEPGMGLVIWAETSGAALIEKIFTNSIELDGESILTFIRALCAISQEELEPTDGSPAKLYLLQRVVECAYFNSGRIRLVWQRLWTVVSQHLVSAACCPDTYVAMFAVDSLRQLADKLLCRTELAGFASQGEAIRPLGSVLRCSDSVAVRELAIACVAHIVDSHQDRIVGGWWAVIDALAIAASDSSSQVVAHAIDIMRPVFNALYLESQSRSGHECMEECITAAVAAVANQNCGGDTGPATSALELFQTICQRLYESNKQDKFMLQKWVNALSPLGAIARSDPRPEVADTAATVLFYCLTSYGDCFDGNMWGTIFGEVVEPMLSLHPAQMPPNVPGLMKAKPRFERTPIKLKFSRNIQRSFDSLNELPSPQRSQASSEGSLRIIRQANAYLPGLWEYMSDKPAVSEPLVVPSLDILWSYSLSTDDVISQSSEALSQTLFSVTCEHVSTNIWMQVAKVFEKWLTLPTLDGFMTLEGLRRTCDSIMIGSKILLRIFQSCRLPDDVTMNIIQVLKKSNEAIHAANDSKQTRETLGQLIDAASRQSRSNVSAVDPVSSFADAVVKTVECTDDHVEPAFARLEMLCDTSLLESLIAAASKSTSDEMKQKMYSMAVGAITETVHKGDQSLSSIKYSSQNTDSLWLETTRIAFSAECLLYLAKDIPQQYWKQEKNDMMACASRMVKSHDTATRKSISTFFNHLGDKQT